MKSLFKIGALFLLMAVSLTSQSQSFNLSGFAGTNETNILSGSLTYQAPSGLIVGLGGSHALSSFFVSEKRKGNDYADNSNNIAKNYPELSDPANAKYIREIFTEDRGTVSAFLGYGLKNTTLTVDGGLVFQQRIVLATTGQISQPITPQSTNYWQSFTSGPSFAYGFNLTQYFGKSGLGLTAGYGNVTNFRIGLSYRFD